MIIKPVRPRWILVALLLSSCASVDSRLPEDSPDAAAAYFAAKRGNVDVVARWSDAAAAIRSQSHNRIASNAAITREPWQFLGPGNIGGRTRALVIDPNDTNTIYAGAVSGGIFKTTNGGITWRAIGDAMNNLAVATLVMSPADSKTLFAGTGEGYFREDVRGTDVPIRGDGIFVTHDGGDSWTQLASTKNREDFYWINKLVVSAHDPRRLYAATRTGVWRSRDEGASWTRILDTNVKGGCLDLALRPKSDGDYALASCGIFTPATIYLAKNAESDAAWAEVLTSPSMSRTSLAFAPSDPSIVYALSARNVSGEYDQSLLAVYRSEHAGEAGSWIAKQTYDGARPGSLLLSNAFTETTPECNESPTKGSVIGMGWHCNTIAVDPLDPNRVWAGGVDMFRSDDGGATWGEASYWWSNTNAGGFSHADHHAIVFDPHYDGAGNQRMYVTNDGGVYRTENSRANVAVGNRATCDVSNTEVLWTTLVRDFGATQFYHGAVTSDGLTFIGGAQDNGTLLGHYADGVNAWDMIWGGDGGYVAIDPHDDKHFIYQSQYGALVRTVNGGAKGTPTMPSFQDNYLFVTPFAFDPFDSSRLWCGGTKIWRGSSTSTFWLPATNAIDGHVSALAVDPGNASFVVAGTTSGKVYRSATAISDIQANWAFSSPRAGWIASLVFDGAAIYATYANFGGQHIWKSLDGAQTWTAIDGDLPDLPVHAIAASPLDHHLYIGTDLGVFSSSDGGAHWQHDDALPQVITEWVQIARGMRGPAVYAFTHGRGVWRVELTSAPPRRRSLV